MNHKKTIEEIKQAYEIDGMYEFCEEMESFKDFIISHIEKLEEIREYCGLSLQRHLTAKAQDNSLPASDGALFVLEEILSIIKHNERNEKMKDKIIGKQVIVRAKLAGVHFGTVEDVDFETHTISLLKSRRLWRIYTRDESGSVSDIAANGLKKNANHSIGATLERVIITEPDGLEIAQCSTEASESILGWEIS